MSKKYAAVFVIGAVIAATAVIAVCYGRWQPVGRYREDYLLVAADFILGSVFVLLPRLSNNENLKSRKTLLTVLGGVLLLSGIAVPLMKLFL